MLKQFLHLFMIGLCINVVYAKELDNFYKGKTIKLIVGYAPGGTYDVTARFLAPYLERKTGANVIVINTPGGGGITALNKFASTQSNETALMLVNTQGSILSEILDAPNVRYTFQDFPLVSQISFDSPILLINKELPYKTLQEFKDAKTRIKFAGGGKIDSIADYAAILSEILGLDSHIIIGYKGSKEAALAVMRGECDALMVSSRSAQAYVSNNLLLPIASFGKTNNDLFKDLPMLQDAFELDVEMRKMFDFRLNIALAGNTLIAQKNLPTDHVAYFQTIFKTILDDQNVIEAAKHKNILLEYHSLEQTRRMIQKIYTQEDSLLERIRHIILEKYYK